MAPPDFRDRTLPVDARVDALLSQLRLPEKLRLCAGRDFWRTKSVRRLGLRPFRMSDGPRGVAWHSARKRGTSFPSGIALGASFDVSLARRMGEALAEEARGAGCAMILGPAVNLCRTPLCGRTFEYLSEDPQLNARLAVPFVAGVQSRGVAACVKHFAANNQETDRVRVDVRVGQRALRELYLPAFEASVKEAGAWSVMAAYNAVNGRAACEQPDLLRTTLREEWGFEGFVVSDWFATGRTAGGAACLKAGLSLEMPGRGLRLRPAQLRRALARGELEEADVDRALEGLLRVMFETGHIDGPPLARAARISTPAHQALSQEIAEGGLTLLKNEQGALPIAPDSLRTLAVLGPRANTRHGWPLWGGSSGVWPPFEVTPKQGLAEAIGDRVEIVDDAAAADAAVVFVGLTHRPGQDSEVRDRVTLQLPAAQVELIERTAAANPRTIVVIVAGSPVAMDWLDRVPAVLMAWYPGMNAGRAIARVLTGEVSPSGKLPITFPRRLGDSPAHASTRTFPGEGHVVHYDEGVFVGYRHFDREGIEPLFCFGHGLSYTRFEYGALEVRPARWEGEGALDVAFDLANTGPRRGAEVAQIYVGEAAAPVPRPPRELVGFEKRVLEAGERVRVELKLRPRDLAWYDERRAGWRADAGTYDLWVGASSRDLRLHGRVILAKDWFEAVV